MGRFIQMSSKCVTAMCISNGADICYELVEPSCISIDSLRCMSVSVSIHILVVLRLMGTGWHPRPRIYVSM